MKDLFGLGRQILLCLTLISGVCPTVETSMFENVGIGFIWGVTASVASKLTPQVTTLSELAGLTFLVGTSAVAGAWLQKLYAMHRKFQISHEKQCGELEKKLIVAHGCPYQALFDFITGVPAWKSFLMEQLKDAAAITDGTFEAHQTFQVLVKRRNLPKAVGAYMDCKRSWEFNLVNNDSGNPAITMSFAIELRQETLYLGKSYLTGFYYHPSLSGFWSCMSSFIPRSDFSIFKPFRRDAQDTPFVSATCVVTQLKDDLYQLDLTCSCKHTVQKPEVALIPDLPVYNVAATPAV